MHNGLIDILFTKPIINASKVFKIINKTPNSAYKLITSLEGLGILEEITGQQRGRLYSFSEYLSLFKS